MFTGETEGHRPVVGVQKNMDAKEAYERECQAHDRSPLVSLAGHKLEILLSHAENGPRGQVVGPRWRDLHDPNQAWEEVFGIKPEGPWHPASHERREGTINAGGVTIEFKSAC